MVARIKLALAVEMGDGGEKIAVLHALLKKL